MLTENGGHLDDGEADERAGQQQARVRIGLHHRLVVQRQTAERQHLNKTKQNQNGNGR